MKPLRQALVIAVLGEGVVLLPLLLPCGCCPALLPVLVLHAPGIWLLSLLQPDNEILKWAIMIAPSPMIWFAVAYGVLLYLHGRGGRAERRRLSACTKRTDIGMGHDTPP